MKQVGLVFVLNGHIQWSPTISDKNIDPFSIYNLSQQNLSGYLKPHYLELIFGPLGQITIFISNILKKLLIESNSIFERFISVNFI